MANFIKIHHIKKARKDYPDDGIKKGDEYFWWKWRYGTKQRSPVRPTSLDKYPNTAEKEWTELQYRVQMKIDAEEYDADLLQELQEYADAQEDKISCIPEVFEDTEQSQQMQQRFDEATEMTSTLENLEDE